jgi:hypothetical protein
MSREVANTKSIQEISGVFKNPKFSKVKLFLPFIGYGLLTLVFGTAAVAKI